MHYHYHALTDTGLVRQNNEDAVIHDETLGLALLADGMGGYSAGEVAAGIAISFIHDEFGRWLAGAGKKASVRDIRRAMQDCAAEANRAILATADERPECAGMGTTLVFSVFLESRVLIGHIGDSRCYRWRGGRLAQITRDHSVLQERLDAGLINAAEAATAPYRNLVTRALGFETGGELDVGDHAVEPGDIYLLCSDGLTDMLPDEALAVLLAGDLPISGRAASLVEAANAAGGRDNVSVLLVQAEGESPKRGPVARWLET
jgi:serine/threonine protein phosphatase PrpC